MQTATDSCVMTTEGPSSMNGNGKRASSPEGTAVSTLDLIHEKGDNSDVPPATLMNLVVHNHGGSNGNSTSKAPNDDPVCNGSEVDAKISSPADAKSAGTGPRVDEEVTDPAVLAAALNSGEFFGPGDAGDAWGFGRGGGTQPTSGPTAGPIASMPVEKDAERYNMGHARRGVALIFNHKNFDPRLGLKQRNGTDADRDNLKETLRLLDFEVRVYEDLPFKELDRVLHSVSLESHSDADCILVAVLSHGELGILYASDHAYKPDQLWTQFNAERCPSLAGKPKMFLIQACQGDQLDGGVHLKQVAHHLGQTETDSSATSYKIPTHADFLIVYSTIPGFYSWRNTSAGSWFVQALCHVLRRVGRSRDFLSNLTWVSRKVAFDFQSNTPGDYMMHEKKQIPCVSSMLTRDIFFSPKAHLV